MHEVDTCFGLFTRPELQQLAQTLALRNREIWQSMYIFKQPGIGGEVAGTRRHIFETTAISVTTFWFRTGRCDGTQRMPVDTTGAPQPAA